MIYVSRILLPKNNSPEICLYNLHLNLGLENKTIHRRECTSPFPITLFS